VKNNELPTKRLNKSTVKPFSEPLTCLTAARGIKVIKIFVQLCFTQKKSIHELRELARIISHSPLAHFNIFIIKLHE